MLDKLEALRGALSVIAEDDPAIDAIKAKMLADKSLADGKKYSEAAMDKSEREEFNDAAQSLLKLNVLFDEVVELRAKIVRKYYSSLVATGFTPAQAITIAAQGKGMVVGDFE